jgi:hypothetical protein
MTMRNCSPLRRPRNGTSRLRRGPIRGPIYRLALAGLLGAAVPLLISCGSSGAGLIPVQNADPLQSDFETVAQTAENGDGSCAATEAAILKTERDFSALPSTLDEGLRNRLHEGIAKLHADALTLCKQSLPQATATNTSPRTTTGTRTTTTTPTVTQPPTPTTTPTTSTPGGGTPAPGAGAGEVSPGGSSEQGAGAGEGAAHAGSGPSAGAGAGAGAQEGGK